MEKDYQKKFNAICTNPFITIIANKYYGLPIDDVEERIFDEIALLESNYLLSGKTCIVYPNIKYFIARKAYPGYLSTDWIFPGERYLRYDPFIIAARDLDDRKSYQKFKLKKPIICREAFSDVLPENIGDLDIFAQYTDFGMESDTYPNVNFSNLNEKMGGGLVLKPISKP